MGTINWTLEAERWLKDIYDYIALDNPSAAFDTVQAIYERVQNLELHPEMGERYHLSERNVRILLHDHYRIVYLVRTDGVDVLGVFHGALDITKYQL